MIFGATISIHYGPVKYLDISISQKMTDRKSKARAAARAVWGCLRAAELREKAASLSIMLKTYAWTPNFRNIANVN